MITGYDFPKLLECPVTRRIPRDVAMRDPARRMLNHNEYAEYLERRRHHCREIVGHVFFLVVPNKSCPALVGASVSSPTAWMPGHVSPDLARRYAQTQLQPQLISKQYS